MNPAFDQLATLVGSRLGADRDNLVNALYLVRAHYSLSAIVRCCQRLRDLLDEFPLMDSHPELADQMSSVRLLQGIASLDSVDAHFVDGEVGKDVKTPLRPFTGDSSLLDLLMIRPGEGASGAHEHDYMRVQAWFAWQTFLHQLRRSTRAAYLRYLTGAGVQRLNTAAGARIYGAFLVLRRLADSKSGANAHDVAELLGEPSEAGSRQLGGLLRIALARQVSRATRNAYSRQYALGDAELDEKIEHVRAIQRRFRAADENSVRADLRRIRQLLEYIWYPIEGPRAPGWRHVQERARAELEALDVRRYGPVVAISQEVDPGGIHEGKLLELFLDPPEKVYKRRGRTAVDDDPELEEPVIPDVSLWLGSGDPTRAFYASRSALQHIEQANALLPWQRWRLSQHAISEVLSEVRLERDERASERCSRLALGLSLVTGRDFNEVAETRVVRFVGAAHDASIFVTASDHVLHVQAGRPDLRPASLKTDPLPEYCAPWARWLRLPLPKAWWPLIDSLLDQGGGLGPGAESAARRRIRALDPDLGISERGIRCTLWLALLGLGDGDLALIKAVADMPGINAQNLIHYASYDRNRIEHTWRRAVTPWVGELPKLALGQYHDERVGSIHGFVIEKMALHVDLLKEKFSTALREKRWDAVFDNLVAYTALWFGLATAGRSSRQPVPGVVTEDGWALVRDKHHPDESTDRYVPLRPSVRRQLSILRALTEAFGVGDTMLPVPRPGGLHLLELQLFHRRGRDATKGYRPKDLDRNDAVLHLPGNWGRKLVRSAGEQLSGRFKDAGLGHWVRGRHPWTLTSTFPSCEFRRQWLELQAELERALHFEVLDIEGLGPPIRPLVYPAPGTTAGGASTSVVPRRRTVAQSDAPGVVEARDEEVKGWLDHCKSGLYEAVFRHEPPIPEAAMALARDAVRAAMKEQGVIQRHAISRQSATSEDMARAAEAVTSYIRRKTGIPLLAVRPRMRFQRNWMVSGSGFRALAYVEQSLLPAIERDLSWLPRRGERKAQRRCDTGRLIAALALRGGVCSGAHIDAVMCALWKRRSVDALGDARLLEIEVRYAHTREPMGRTIFLEPWLATFITVERKALWPYLDGVFGATPVADAPATAGGADALMRKRGSGLQIRLKRWQRDLRTYLRSLGLPAKITLSAFLAAVYQRIQLDSAPVLAAYAGGEILTHDLPVSELCRLGGYEHSRSTVSSRAGDASLVEQDDDAVLNPYSAVDGLPRGFDAELAATIAGDTSTSCSGIAKLRKKIHGDVQRLMCGFADWLLVDHARHRGPQVNEHVRQRVRRYAALVWSGLIGFADGDKQCGAFDEAVLVSLFDLTSDYAPARIHHGAWHAFRAFLADPEADHAGATIASLGPSGSDLVSAKILSRKEMDEIETLVASVRSGIGTAAVRDVAGRHFALTRAIGARRSETANLRWLDVDDVALRIRPYDGHTLKTVASERAVPVRLLDGGLWHRLEAPRADGTSRVIDVVPGVSPSGDNFFAAVSAAMKRVTGDDSVGPHHMRHTWASMMTLRMLGNAINLDRLAIDLPWVESSLPPEASVSVLLGPEGQCGQGLKAIAAALGHQHETTTLKHYVHTLCVGLYAYELDKPRIPIRKSFERRVPSRATSFRHVSAAKQESADPERQERWLRDDLEQRVEAAHADARSASRPCVRVAKPKQVSAAAGNADVVHWQQRAQQQLVAFEALQNYLKTGQGEPPADTARVKAAFKRIAAIRSGKRGSALPRHPMPECGFDGSPLPAMLLANIAESNAERLLAWLLRLESEYPNDHCWLMDKWLSTSDAHEGSMRLDGAEDLERVRALSVDPGLSLEVRAVAVSKRRQRGGASPRYRMRIRFARTSERRAHVAANKKSQRSLPRDGRAAGAIRWVMTWVAAAADASSAWR